MRGTRGAVAPRPILPRLNIASMDTLDIRELMRLADRRSSAMVFEGYATPDRNLLGNLMIVGSSDAVYSFAESDIIDQEDLAGGRRRVWVRFGADAYRLSPFFVAEQLSFVETFLFTPLQRPTFASLERGYSMDVHQCPDIATSPNQCAVRLSRALIQAGIAMDADYPGNLCRHGYARGAQDLGAFLKNKWGPRDLGFSGPGSAPSDISSKSGVILFANIPHFDGQGHIDLWDGTNTKSGSYWDADPIWFWKLT